jgi:hypothetical protein
MDVGCPERLLSFGGLMQQVQTQDLEGLRDREVRDRGLLKRVGMGVGCHAGQP